ncbi:DUF6950 family protein [Ancylobacter defluvii]|uniref:DUF6950 domain-containing protein n=1 Tax=Ancylobacter defluvii TaxID=1282440 RepID=A0A9W6NCM6_9HYPH|nr:hypothetical protein [Ancylobacter defluvii]MBS7588297.1 hypothetical protein [Ancylobacter defluvii]GLK86694.1 hypothetical protein GCM10017653_47640 [Ancylobacter defluvii]
MLRSFLIDHARRPVLWGAEDCCLLIADWWLLNHGVDPAAAYRGTYATEAEKDAVVAACGGVARIVRRLALDVGAERTGDPQPGDFGVVRIDRKHIGAIRAPDGKWAAKSVTGLVMFRPPLIVASWKI